jgi:hypothetical protein
VATLTECDSVQIDPPIVHSGSSILPSLPSPGTAVKWWKITPNAMAFENIEVSRAVTLPGELHLLSFESWLGSHGCRFLETYQIARLCGVRSRAVGLA